MNSPHALTSQVPAPAAARVRTRSGAKPLVMIDAFNLGLSKGTGVATYARNLSATAQELGCEVSVLYGAPVSSRHPPVLKEVLFYDSEASPPAGLRHYIRRARALARVPWHSAFEIPINGAVVPDAFAAKLPRYDRLWNARDLYVQAIAQYYYLGVRSRVSTPRPVDLVHWTYPLPIHVPGVPNIYTLHDLVPLRLPQATLDRKEPYFNLMKWICKTAAHIVTVSENSKRDIVELLGVDPDKVTNTYQAVVLPEEHLRKSDEQVKHEIERTTELKYKEYFLYFGALDPRKNMARLIEAYLVSAVEAPLVLIGGEPGSGMRDTPLFPLDRAIQEVRAAVRNGLEQGKGKIVRMEYVPFSSLLNLIRGAKAVVFPSLYEGFGLPLLEAMMLGTPVLTSNNSSIPEVVGDAALLIDAYRVQDIAEGLRKLDSDAGVRAELSARGRKRAAAFDESSYRERLAGVYDRVLASHG